jgi:hypothetical protein
MINSLTQCQQLPQIKDQDSRWREMMNSSENKFLGEKSIPPMSNQNVKEDDMVEQAHLAASLLKF